MVKLDLADFERTASNIGGARDQIAYALSQSLNDGLFAARDYAITSTWPKGVEVRDPNFMRNALRVEKASKSDLSGAVTTEGTRAGDRGHLAMHETGGHKTPAKARIAVPSLAVKGKRTARGVPKILRPTTAQRAFRRGDVIYQVQGRGKRARLRLLYTLKTGVPIKPTVPFHSDFDATMRRVVTDSFPSRFKDAMASRRR